MIALNFKAQFMRNEALVKAHQALAVSEQFQIALEMSLLAYQASLHSDTGSAVDSTLKFQRLEGAQDFVKVLLNIAEPPQLPPKKTETGLKYG